MNARTKTNLRILLIILCLLCIPLNVSTIRNGLHSYHEHIAGAGGVIVMGAIGLVWCLCAAIINTLIVLQSKQS